MRKKNRWGKSHKSLHYYSRAEVSYASAPEIKINMVISEDVFCSHTQTHTPTLFNNFFFCEHQGKKKTPKGSSKRLQGVIYSQLYNF